MADQIFLVEDDENIRELVVYALKTAGFEATGFATAGEFYKGLDAGIPQLLLLDIMLPDEDGISILKKLRNNSRLRNIPVIMLTAKSTEYDKVIGLDSGADDYVTKPFGVMELLSRVRAVLRRSGSPSEEETLVLGDLVLDTRKHEVFVQGKPVALTFKEFELLNYLMKNRNIVLTRDKILDVIWNYEYEGESRTVDVHIGSLRQKLGPCGNMIKTVRGVGYKLEDKG
ncbi:MAG: response regulator transcription factor [Candidatus Limivivens sp.]|nr:response regulator transcription factor [Candidatus Limivivens sp.]